MKKAKTEITIALGFLCFQVVICGIASAILLLSPNIDVMDLMLIILSSLSIGYILGSGSETESKEKPKNGVDINVL